MRKAFQFTLAAIAFCTISLIESCSSEEVEKCDGKLTATSETTNVTSCATPNGSITITASNGTAPYQYQLNGGTAQASATFSNLAAGSYVITVTDDKGCEFELDANVGSTASTVNFSTITTKARCDNNTKGTIDVSATGGTGPYQYAIGSGAYGGTNSFSGLNAGNHTVKVKDSNGCEVSKSVTIGVESALTYDTNIKAIIDTNCATNSNCHGSGASGRPVLTNYDAVKNSASAIRNRVVGKTMPPGGGLSDQALIDQIACWADSGTKQN